MKVELIPFQGKAVKELRINMARACDNYNKYRKTEVISLQAPTGAGKTIIAAALIESVYFGITLTDGSVYTEQPEAIFVWLSDSPELNEQSKQKIELKTSKLRFGQCETITEDSFDRETLEDGKIYFLNTQKISKNGNLTKHGDKRHYTIWETLDNTIVKKADHLYFIIDEAHRGAKSKTASGTDTTIMQRFIKGYEYKENGVTRTMRSMPVVLGISATAKRFNTLIEGLTNVSLQTYVVTADEVRSSGLLKDRIAAISPQDNEKNSDIVLLEAAVEEWIKKCKRWYQYTYEQHYANVDPVFVVQVCKSSNNEISDTSLEDVLAKIEEKYGKKFSRGEVVHCFGETSKVEINGLEIPHVNASDIADDHKIKVVFFKEALSTGWDCPRAETMMSFAARNDPTYIAQLLGRMVRTPLQMRVTRDEFLNDVKLYLPHFDKDNVKKIINELQSNEGSEIPIEINGESLAEPTYITYTVHVAKRREQKQIEGQVDWFDLPHKPANTGGGEEVANTDVNPTNTTVVPVPEYVPSDNEPDYRVPKTVTVSKPAHTVSRTTEQTEKAVQLSFEKEINRKDIIDFINAKAFVTYQVRHERINDYLKSLLDLADLLTHKDVYSKARDEVIEDIVGMIRSYIEELYGKRKYDDLARKVLEHRFAVNVYDVFGHEIKDIYNNLTLFSESDLDRRVREADAVLGRYGFAKYYGNKYYKADSPNAYKIDFILFASDESCRNKLSEYAKNKFIDFNNQYRVKVANKSDAIKAQYHKIVADSDAVSKQIFTIPENIVFKEETDGKEYTNHLLAAEKTGIAKIKMNGWESELIETEAKHNDFICWLRNPENGWGLCLYYEKDNKTKRFYPDFLVIRENPDVGYIVDVLEPHGNQYADNLPKAKSLAMYAKEETRLGRIQLIHKNQSADGSKFVRLELTDIEIQEKVLHANTDDELHNIFVTKGIVE